MIFFQTIFWKFQYRYLYSRLFFPSFAFCFSPFNFQVLLNFHLLLLHVIRLFKGKKNIFFCYYCYYFTHVIMWHMQILRNVNTLNLVTSISKTSTNQSWITLANHHINESPFRKTINYYYFFFQLYCERKLWNINMLYYRKGLSAIW